jgi:eukaryotic-like serine/threonine-protein kinase
MPMNKKMVHIITSIFFFCVLVTAGANQQIVVKKDSNIQSKTTEQESSTVAAGTDWWPMFMHDVKHTGYSTESAPKTNAILWRSAAGNAPSTPVIIDGKVYVGSQDKKVYCFDAETGQQLWNTTINFPIYTAPAVVSQKVYVSSNSLYCLNAENGSILWQKNEINNPSDPIITDNQRIYVRSYSDKKVYCLSTNGETIWSYLLGGKGSACAVFDNKVYVTSDDHKVYCLDAVGNNNGTTTLLWTYTTEPWVNLLTNPTVISDRVYFGYDKLYCLNASGNGDGTTTKLWDFQIRNNYNVYSTPAIAYGNVYFIGDNSLYSVNASTGIEQWNRSVIDGIVYGVAVADGKVYFAGGFNNKVFCYDAITGIQCWNYTTGGTIQFSSPAISNGKMYIGSFDGNLYCFADNFSPTIPTVQQSPTQGIVGQELEFSTTSTDPENDLIWYQWTFGATTTAWLGPYNSGVTIQKKYIFSNSGSYNIQVRVKDQYGHESSWSAPMTITITTPTPQLIITAPPSAIEGYHFLVTITVSGNPLSQTMVTFAGATYHTQSDGQLNLLAPNITGDTQEFVITAIHENYTTVNKTITILKQSSSAEPKGWVFGDVYDTSGEPISQANVCIISTQQGQTVQECTFTDLQGKYYRAVSPGSYSVQVTKQGYTSKSSTLVSVLEKTAKQVSFTLETSAIPSSSPTEFVDYAIQYGIEQQIIGATITVSSEQPNITVYDSNVEITQTKTQNGVVQLIVNGETAKGTVIAIRLDNPTSLLQSSIQQLKDLQVTYDGQPLVLAENIGDIFSPSSTNQPLWVGVITEQGVLTLLIYIPHFSEHTITISSILETLSGPTMVIIYATFSIIAAVFLLGPRIRNIVRRELYMRNKK